MCQYTFELAPLKAFEKPRRHSYRRMCGITSRCKGVRCRIIDDIHTRFRKPRGDSQIFNDAVELKPFGAISRLRTRRGDGDFVREPVRCDVHHDTDSDSNPEDTGIFIRIRNEPTYPHDNEKERGHE